MTLFYSKTALKIKIRHKKSQNAVILGVLGQIVVETKGSKL